jgi:DNA-directed RNA polymerase subunit RPC12/RpoP
MSGDVTVYICTKCKKEFGFIEHFSHDHPDFLNDSPVFEDAICPECKKAEEKNINKRAE